MSTVDARRSARPVPPWLLATAFAVVVVAGLLWAKWQPYSVKVPSVAGSHTLGRSIVTGGEPAPPAVSLSAGLDFAGTYLSAVWPALVAGLVIAAAVATTLPPNWLARTFGRSGAAGAVRGGALALPSLMCTCCAAPIAVGLRRRAASVTSTLAYWLANPALNPVVLAFCAFVLPWPWTVLRAGAGVVVVVASVALARPVARRPDAATAPAEVVAATTPAANAASSAPTPNPAPTRPLPLQFLATLGRLAIRLLPEYLLLVVALGALRGVLFPLGTEVAVGVVGAVVLAVAGALLPVPTGAEVAVVAALLAAGVAGPVAAALLITLPALSLPSLLMVRRVFPGRLLVGVTAVVAGAGLASAAVAAAIGL